MSMCRICFKDSKVHTKKLWEKHQTAEVCLLCQKSNGAHTDKLWQMHKSAIFEGAKSEKLSEITVGFSRKSVARRYLSNTAGKNLEVELIPIYVYCRECSLAVGSVEEDFAELLDGLCIKCFRELIGQDDSYYDKFPSYRSYEYCQKIRKRMEEDAE